MWCFRNKEEVFIDKKKEGKCVGNDSKVSKQWKKNLSIHEELIIDMMILSSHLVLMIVIQSIYIVLITLNH